MKYIRSMENNLVNLSRLSNSQLENLENFCVCKGRDELHDQVLAEMRSRSDFSPSSYDLMLVLEGC